MGKRADYYVYGDGRRFADLNLREAFERIRKDKGWVVDPQQDTVSGSGSTLTQTREIIKSLPPMLDTFRINTVLDIPCGDFNWMKEIDWQGRRYLGADILPELVSENNEKYSNGRISFSVVDLTTDTLPEADMIFCRDCLVHFSYQDIIKALRNIKQSSSKFLMTTTFPEEEMNEDIITGGWRPLNFGLAPFSFPEPLYLLNEHCTEGDGLFSDKSLGLWEVRSLPI